LICPQCDLGRNVVFYKPSPNRAPLHLWLQAIALMAASKKGNNSCENYLSVLKRGMRGDTLNKLEAVTHDSEYSERLCKDKC